MSDAFLIRDESGEVVVGFASKTAAEAWLDRHGRDGFTLEVAEIAKEERRAPA